MNLEHVKLSQLRALVAVAECGNFGEAGLQLSVSQSAVSHAIAALEQELGVVLLSRGRHGATLTPVGERVLIHAHNILRSLDELGKEANLAKGLQGGAVRIASFRSVATHVLPSVIAVFRERFPAIGIVLNEFPGCVAVEQDLRDGRADIGITLLPTSEEFRSWEILRDEYLVLIPPNYQVIHEPLTWEDLSTYPLILSPEGDSCRELFLHHLTALGKSLKPTYEVREDSTIVSMIRQGLGVGIIPRLAAEPIPVGIQKRSLPNPLERIIGVAILAEALQSPAVYAFLDTLKEMSQRGQLTAA
ncbi:LysR family transcriptional regulator [Thermocoleostomius sinensis]|jgi:DNA-binding transcriptional LysR family regulator|uniref:LysR family transcriptional regulator n=1 Tax=Thermocoleostomius sinensis A174 TaxID=2016057 RepID=A0A9E8ZEL6_9CYAN|nr:LysR family transcriptional regulator [Thermocoleostomius sinensis]WAL61582.1 LysR family transcriptional regulator [Thermocoleostomius sinensis A174]